MTRPNVHIIDIETQEEIVREMNDEEYAQHLIDSAEAETARAEAEAAAETTPPITKRSTYPINGLMILLTVIQPPDIQSGFISSLSNASLPYPWGNILQAHQA